MGLEMIRARVKLPNLPVFALDIPMRSGHEAFGFLAAFIAHCEGVDCPVRQAYRAMGMEDSPHVPDQRSGNNSSAANLFLKSKKGINSRAG